MENMIRFIYGGTGILLGVLFSWFFKFFLSYMNKKDENLATKEDIREITAQIESVRTGHAASLEFLKTDLTIYQEIRLSLLREKIDIYRTAIFPTIKLITTTKKLDPDKMAEFDRERLEIHAQLGLIAPQSVLDAYDFILDYLFNVLDKKDVYNWPKMRELGFNFINEIRKDIGINTNPVTYRGER